MCHFQPILQWPEEPQNLPLPNQTFYFLNSAVSVFVYNPHFIGLWIISCKHLDRTPATMPLQWLKAKTSIWQETAQERHPLHFFPNRPLSSENVQCSLKRQLVQPNYRLLALCVAADDSTSFQRALCLLPRSSGEVRCFSQVPTLTTVTHSTKKMLQHSYLSRPKQGHHFTPPNQRETNTAQHDLTYKSAEHITLWRKAIITNRYHEFYECIAKSVSVHKLTVFTPD